MDGKTCPHSYILLGTPLIDFMPPHEVTNAHGRKYSSLKFSITAFLFIGLWLIWWYLLPSTFYFYRIELTGQRRFSMNTYWVNQTKTYSHDCWRISLQKVYQDIIFLISGTHLSFIYNSVSARKDIELYHKAIFPGHLKFYQIRLFFTYISGIWIYEC